MILHFENAKELTREFDNLLYDVSWNGIEIGPAEGRKDDCLPIPWDAGISIEGDKLIMCGGAGPSGWGSVRVSIPKKDSGAYHFEIHLISKDDPIFSFKLSKKIRFMELLNELNINYDDRLD
ncbi:hypothetical protein C4577_02970 [Candidatus Parcubacteria bacterium]|nr:MAG: hypothetical protein C4577_02970 [Candidatus Parcubacteria bacterium]